jgi:hypothetical protein
MHRTEDTETHNWVLRNHLRSAGKPPEVLASDREGALIQSYGHLSLRTVRVRVSEGFQQKGFSTNKLFPKRGRST